MSTTITPRSVIQRNEGMIQAEIDGDTVMMSVENGSYYGLDEVAGHIWEIIATPHTFQSLVTRLMESYEVSREQCQEEAARFIDTLVQYNIITVTNG